MAKGMKATTAVLLAAEAVLVCLYRAFPSGVLLTAAITCGTAGYHFGVRLLVGAIFTWTDPRHDPARLWYRLRPWEETLYKKLNVKAWKNALPTYSPERFSPWLHSWEEIARAMCRSELVHEVNAVLSFCPLAASIWFGDFPVFLITSTLGAAFDLLFVIVQRFNRTRILQLVHHQKKREENEYEPE